MWLVGSFTYKGVRFHVFPNDHPPRHVHAYLGDAIVIIDLRFDGNVKLANRADAVRHAKKSDVQKALERAAESFDELVRLWEKHHG